MVIDLNYPWPYLATAGIVTLLGLYAWKQPRRPGTRYFAWLVGAWLVCALAAAFQTVLQPLELRYVMWALLLPALLVVSALELMFLLEYTGNEKWLTRRNAALLALPALTFGLLALTLPRSALASIHWHAGAEVIVAHDLVRWGFSAYFLALLLIGLAVLAACLLRAPAYSAPILLIALGQIVPRVVPLMIDTEQLNVSGIQVTILISNFCALAYAIALYSYKLLWLIPVARDTAIRHMPYGMIVLDAENRLVDFSPAVQALPGLAGKLALRQPAASALGDWWEQLAPLLGPAPVSSDIIVPAGVGQQTWHVHSVPLRQASGWRMGQVFVLEDVTLAKQAQRRQAQTLWVQASLQEREHLADELHDGLSQTLGFLNLQAQAAQVYLQAGQSQAASATLARLTEAAGQIQDETRELIGNLLTVNLLAEDFGATLRQVLAGFEQQTGLPVRLEIVGDAEALCAPARLPPPVAVQLVRIVQEALANVRKHAPGATQVCVQIKAGAGQMLVITITDNGAGFDPTTSPAGRKQFGLQVMRQRAARVGGSVAIASAPGKGTAVEVCVPLTVDETRSAG